MSKARRSSVLVSIWPLTVGAAALLVAVLFPPAFWLCFVGGALLSIVMVANSNRTGESMNIPWRSSGTQKLTVTEATTGVTAVVVMAVPLVVAIAKSILG